MTKEDKKRDSRLRCTYGISLAEYNAELEKQGGVCVCGRPKKNVALHQDHGHKIAKLKITVTKTGIKFRAYNREYGYVYYSRNRKKAVREVRRKLRRRSCRGVLCWACNTALKKFEDDWKKMFKLAKYLKYWQREQGWDYKRKERVK